MRHLGVALGKSILMLTISVHWKALGGLSKITLMKLIPGGDDLSPAGGPRPEGDNLQEMGVGTTSAQQEDLGPWVKAFRKSFMDGISSVQPVALGLWGIVF